MTLYYLFLTFPHLFPKVFFEWLKMFGLKFMYNAAFTSPSIVYHSLYDMRLRSTSKILHNSLPLSSSIDEEKHDVIVCIHGRGGHPSDFQHLIGKLQLYTNHKFLAFHLNNSHTKVSEDALTLKELLDPLMNQIKSIVLIGLSKGGLIAIKFALNCNLVKKIITVSSPLNGTYIANNYPFCSNTRKELAYNSDLTQELREQSKGLEIYSIVPKFDHMIIPTDSSYYPHSTTYFYTGHYSHAGIIYAPEVIDQIKDWIF
jgi:triacylglycerol esterase/lipase EstA (alpha/beta hydrolase family)